MSDIKKDINKHNCKYKVPSSGYGEAICYCIEDDEGKFWVGNDEYESQVNYCPFCGAIASTPFKEMKAEIV